MTEKMKAAYLVKPGRIEYRQVPVPIPAPDEALIEVLSCGVCGSDVHYYLHGRIGNFVVQEPLVLGHECAGVVVQTGEAVTNVAPGDRVAVEPGVPCRRCHHCKIGRYNLCKDVRFMATPPFDGAFAEYVTHPADFLYKLPEGVSIEEGAMMEPFAVGLYAAQRAGAGIGKTAAVLGAGPIGLCAVQALKASGVSTIIVTDIAESRLKLAVQLGATQVLNASTTEVPDAVRQITGGRGVDIVCETAGTAATVKQTVSLAARGGRIVLVGLPPENEIPLNVVGLLAAEIDVSTVFRYANVYPIAIDLLATGKVDLKAMITHRYGLDRIADALEFATERSPDSIKIMIDAEY